MATDPALTDISGKEYLSPGEVAHVARNVFETGITPVHAQLSYIVQMVRAIAGDPPDPAIPEELRRKGLIAEMRAEHAEFTAEQRSWKAADDREKEIAAAERKQLIEGQADLVARVSALEGEQHRWRKFCRKTAGWLTKKDDTLTVALTKIGGMGTLIVAAGTSLAHLLGFTTVHAVKAVKWIFMVGQ